MANHGEALLPGAAEEREQLRGPDARHELMAWSSPWPRGDLGEDGCGLFCAQQGTAQNPRGSPGDRLESQGCLAGARHAARGQRPLIIIRPAVRIALEGNRMANDQQLHAGVLRASVLEGSLLRLACALGWQERFGDRVARR